MKSVKIGFSSSWDVLNRAGKKNDFFLQFLGKYDVILVPPEEADYLFFTCFNGDHHGEAKADAIKIMFTGENFCPDFNTCDYALSFEYLDYGDRHLRFPLYLTYPDIDKLEARPKLIISDIESKPNFCNFIYSNSKAAPERDLFFLELNKKLPVLSAGKHLQNTDDLREREKISDGNNIKRDYMRDFRFSMSFENSEHPGYVTEKIVDAFVTRTIPIYWGDPRIADEFNPKSFIDVRSFKTPAAAIDYVIDLNENPDKMLQILNSAPLKKAGQTGIYRQKIQAFLENIFDQDQAEARRRPRHGFAGNLEHKRRRDQFGIRRFLKRNRV